ncbi:MAG: hypothetical protein LQ340_006719, partial [Diploschistes diacapsis]
VDGEDDEDDADDESEEDEEYEEDEEDEEDGADGVDEGGINGAKMMQGGIEQGAGESPSILSDSDRGFVNENQPADNPPHVPAFEEEDPNPYVRAARRIAAEFAHWDRELDEHWERKLNQQIIEAVDQIREQESSDILRRHKS